MRKDIAFSEYINLFLAFFLNTKNKEIFIIIKKAYYHFDSIYR